MKLKKTISLSLFLLCYSYYAFSANNIWIKNSKQGSSYFIQKNFDSEYASKNAFSLKKENTVKAKVNDKWNTYKLTDLPKEFLVWNVSERIKGLQQIKAGKMPKGMIGTHDPAVATYGNRRKDSLFELNNAIKGVGYLPKINKIDNVIELLKNNIKKDINTRIDILLGLYNNFNMYFYKNKMVSLELYSSPKGCSQTFLNQLVYPVSVMVFSNHYPNFKLKTITELISPNNPNLLEYEKKLIEYVNLIHDFFHTTNKKTKNIVVIYHIIEVFNNTPAPEGRGIKVDTSK